MNLSSSRPSEVPAPVPEPDCFGLFHFGGHGLGLGHVGENHGAPLRIRFHLRLQVHMHRVGDSVDVVEVRDHLDGVVKRDVVEAVLS